MSGKSSVIGTIAELAFPEASKFIKDIKKDGLGKTILKEAFPAAYAMGQKFRKAKSDKDKPSATSEVTTAIDQLTENTVMTNEILSHSVGLQNAQNEILRDILSTLQDLKSNNNITPDIDLPDLPDKSSKPKAKKPPKARKGYRYNEKTGRYHNEKTNKMVTHEEATGVKAAPKGPAEKVAAPKVGEGIKGGAVKSLGVIGTAYAIYDCYKEVDSLDVNDPDYKKKVTAIIGKAVAQFGLATVGAVFAGMLGTAVVPGIGTIAGIIVGVIGGFAAQLVFGDSIDELVDWVVEKMFEKKAKKVTTGASLVTSDPKVQGASLLSELGAKTEGDKTSVMGDTLTFNASEQIKFIAATMELRANEVILLGGVQSLDDIASSSATPGSTAPGIGSSPGSQDKGASPSASDAKGVGDTSQPTDRGSIDYSGITSKLDLVSVTSKSGPSAKVNKPYQAAFQGLVNDLEARDYKIKSMGGQAVRANANNPNVLSYHSFGAAIDINPATNANGSRQSDMPDGTNAIAAKWGLGWGRNFRSTPDPMHFSAAQGEGGSVPLDRQGNIKGYASGSPSVPKSGPAIVGEKGREKVKRDGKTLVTPGRATAVNLKKGDRVEPHDDNDGLIDIGVGLAKTAISFVPVAGQVVAGAETAYHTYNGDYKKAAKSAIRMAPGGGVVGAVGSMVADYAVDQLIPEKSVPKSPPPPPAKPKKSASGSGSSVGSSYQSSEDTSGTNQAGSKKKVKGNNATPQAQNTSGGLLGMFHPGN
ncbi:D-alanyl-D-alanine carboxypeptidase [uncultured Caudovirales phage]|uniref:D-alanyl-D-alanine carboxypeptidase n=1 Tax=uncultured Caudovirales phage TaxID=2100421 RepID=A0A6J5LEY6_9CAUD|nr:D-alanyl-D-alanine carboxypeptidase [uncultured Caudovirales phage]